MGVMRTFTIAEIKQPGGKPAVYARDRTCAADNCGTRLSIYNPSAFCALHDHGRAAPDETSRPAIHKAVMERRCAYDKCGVLFLATNSRRAYCSDHCRAAMSQQRRVERRAA